MPFEIIELTHLSDGERRNAKRSPGAVAAAPTPNLSCLQIAQSLHHNRWDSCLSFLPHSYTHTQCAHTHTHTQSLLRCAPITQQHQGAGTPGHLSQTRQANRQRHVLYTSADTQIHTFGPFLRHYLSCFHLLSLNCFSPSRISTNKVRVSCLQEASLPPSSSVTKGEAFVFRLLLCSLQLLFVSLYFATNNPKQGLSKF